MTDWKKKTSIKMQYFLSLRSKPIKGTKNEEHRSYPVTRPLRIQISVLTDPLQCPTKVWSTYTATLYTAEVNSLTFVLLFIVSIFALRFLANYFKSFLRLTQCVITVIINYKVQGYFIQISNTFYCNRYF